MMLERWKLSFKQLSSTSQISTYRHRELSSATGPAMRQGNQQIVILESGQVVLSTTVDVLFGTFLVL